MSSGRVACLNCAATLPPDLENTAEFLACPSCQQVLRVFTFPALQRAPAPASSAAAPGAGEATCFYHPLKQAVVPCDSCGRFLCALCDVEIGANHRCPACLETGKAKRNLETMENRRVLYDGIALALAVVPILFWPITLLSAPAALFVVFRYWRRPLSILPRTRIRFVFAALIALAEIGGWIALFYYIFARARLAS